MPYIVPEIRERLDDLTLDELAKSSLTPGELAYCLYRLVLNHGKEGYAGKATVVGVLATVLHEYCRRVIDPYEDRKRAENGDVD